MSSPSRTARAGGNDTVGYKPGLPPGLASHSGEYVFDQSLKPVNTAEIENPSLQFATAGARTPGDYEYRKSTRYTDSTCSLFFWLQLCVLLGIGIWGAVQTSQNAAQIGKSINIPAGIAYSAAPSPSVSPSITPSASVTPSYTPTPSISPSVPPTPSISPSPGMPSSDDGFAQPQVAAFPFGGRSPLPQQPPSPAVELGAADAAAKLASDDGSHYHDDAPWTPPAGPTAIKQYVHPDVSTAMWLLAVGAATAFLLCLAWVAAVLHSGRQFVQFAVAAAFVSLACIAVFCYFVLHSTTLAGISGAVALIVLVWYCTVKAPDREFIASNLEVSISAVGKLPVFWTVVVSTLAVSLVFVVICIGAFVGAVSLARVGHLTNVQSGFMLAGCSVLFIWSLLVFKHTLYFAISGALVDWWKQPFAHQAVERSWLRAWTSSLGTVALGSAYLSVLQLLCDCRGMAKRGQSSKRGACFKTVCFLCVGCWSKLGDAIEFYSPFAFVFANISGTDLHTSGLRAARLFQDKGLTRIVNSRLVDRALQLSVLSIGLVNACIALGLAYIAHASSSEVRDFNFAVASGGALVFGILLGTVASAAVYSAVQTVFLCWAAWPNKLQENHGMQFYELHSTWMAAFPGTMAKAGYDKFSTGEAK